MPSSSMQDFVQAEPQQLDVIMEEEPKLEESMKKQKSSGGFFSNLFSFASKKKEPQQQRQDSSENSDNEDKYMERNLSACECDSDDLEGEMNLSDSEDGSRKRAVFKAELKQERKKKGRSKANKYVVEIDTNIFEIKLDCLKAQTEIATGDAEICKGCAAVLNHKSVLKNNNQEWPCEFCNEVNKVMIMDEQEIPKTEAVTYLLEASSQVNEKKMSGQDISVVFCIDVSGSMCVTEPIKGKFELKGDRRK